MGGVSGPSPATCRGGLEKIHIRNSLPPKPTQTCQEREEPTGVQLPKRPQDKRPTHQRHVESRVPCLESGCGAGLPVGHAWGGKGNSLRCSEMNQLFRLAAIWTTMHPNHKQHWPAQMREQAQPPGGFARQDFMIFHNLRQKHF